MKEREKSGCLNYLQLDIHNINSETHKKPKAGFYLEFDKYSLDDLREKDKILKKSFFKKLNV